MPPTRTVRIFLVYHLRVLADCLASALDPEPGLELESRAWEDPDLLQALDRWPADIALLDTRTHPNRSRSLHQILAARLPALKVVPIGLGRQEEILEWIERGASGFLDCGADLSLLRTTLQEIHLGRVPCPPEIVGAVFERIQRLKGILPTQPGQARSPGPPDAPRNARKGAPHLTARERDVLRLIGAGLQNKQIARRLEISLATVKNHVHRILEKLGASRRREAFQLASDQELLQSRSDRKGS